MITLLPRPISISTLAVLLAYFSSCAQASTISYLTYAVSAVNSGSDGGGTTYANTTYNSDTYGSGGVAGYAYGDLTLGKLGVKLTGNLATGSGAFSGDFAFADLGDTITALGPTAGLNMGVNLTVNGSTYYSDPTQNLTFLAVYILRPGTFDTGSWTSSSVQLFSEGFTLGSGTASYATAFSNYGIQTYGGHYGDGVNTIPLNIPFATIGNNFQVFITMQTYESGDASTGATWNTDFSHTAALSLAAPPGVTLQSASGVLPLSSTPEPALFSTTVLGMAAIFVLVRRRGRSYLVKR